MVCVCKCVLFKSVLSSGVSLQRGSSVRTYYVCGQSVLIVYEAEGFSDKNILFRDCIELMQSSTKSVV